jgi:ubiquinone/menaquinone biosynthesis C-methylase UbiE
MPLRSQSVRVETKASNLEAYRNPEVVSHYAALDYLTACERLLFDTYIKPGMAILDLGVGGGRTTPCLSRKAARYVGVDYSAEMVQSCRRKFPDLEFLVSDASDLSEFSNASFDAIVIAFNGLDCVSPEQRRWQCLRECARVLRAGGVLIFSSHNPRSILVRPAWDRERLRTFARKLVSEQSTFFPAILWSLTGAKRLHSFLRAIAESAGRVLRRVPTPAFWRGEGHLFDPAHGGWMAHCWTPARVREELARFDFRQAAILGDDYPSPSSEFVTDWYYYVFCKDSAAGELCA